MDIFESISTSYKHRPIKAGSLIVVYTHATYSTVRLCAELAAKGFKVVFCAVSYSAHAEYLRSMALQNVQVVDAPEQLVLFLGTADVAIEDGARVSKLIAAEHIPTQDNFFTVEQTSGGIRYLAHNVPAYPVIDVAMSPLKLDIENRRATPESVIQQYSEATGHTLGGKQVLVIGFGSIGEGLARLARVLGANVTVYDDSHVRMMFAKHRGYQTVALTSFNNVLGKQDVVMMATNRYDGNLLNIQRLLLLKDGAIIVNAGSGRGEIAKELYTTGTKTFHDAEIHSIEQDGHLVLTATKAEQTKVIKILGSGYPVNLHLGKGTSHDAIQFVMAMLLLAALDGPADYSRGIHALPQAIQEHIAETYLHVEEGKAFKPTFVSTKHLPLSERPYGGVFPFHNQLNNVAHFAIVRAWFKAGSKTRGHYHLRSQEAYYALQGSAEIVTWKYDEPGVEKQSHQLEAGDYLLVPEGYFHDVIVRSEEDFETLVISSPPFQIWDQFFEQEANNEHTA